MYRRPARDRSRTRLPVADAAHVDVYERGAHVVAHSPGLARHGGLVQEVERDAGQRQHIDRHAVKRGLRGLVDRPPDVLAAVRIAEAQVPLPVLAE